MAMSGIREWLDGQRFEPSVFRCTTDDENATFRLEFKIESEAVAYAEAFGGGVRWVRWAGLFSPSSAREFPLEGFGHRVVGELDPHDKHAARRFGDVEVARGTIVVIEPDAQLGQRVSDLPSLETYLDLTHFLAT